MASAAKIRIVVADDAEAEMERSDMARSDMARSDMAHQGLPQREPAQREQAQREQALREPHQLDVIQRDAPEAAAEAGRESGDVVALNPEAEVAADAVDLPRPEELRLLEALLFAASEPLDEKMLAARLPTEVNLREALLRLQAEYAPRGVNLVRIGNKWTFRTAGDLAWLMTREQVEQKKLSRAAIETLAIIAYHQPVTRAEIEEIRGVSTSKGTLDVLLETGWVRLRGRRKAPGRPVTYGTSEGFLSHFGLEQLGDLPGLEELKGSGLLEGQLPSGFAVPVPSDDPALREDEDPLEPSDLDLGLSVPPERHSEE